MEMSILGCVRTSIGPLPLQGGVRSSQLLIASLKLSVGPRDLPLETTLISELFILLNDLPTKMISLTSGVGELDQSGCARGGRRSGRCADLILWRLGEVFVCRWTPMIEAVDVLLCNLEVLLILSWMLREQDLFVCTLMIWGWLVLPPSVLEPSSRRFSRVRLCQSRDT
ncbi:hypothetical protein CRG98_007682 [Punica granatum]|uniref:Uncharacterized protein n=1 Tax=Punica granatum TaxID=22663 RepID=A0A2I0KTW1_PUNGR|nr:hypothetical protein CRG98_007682 [Punica granatum]